MSKESNEALVDAYLEWQKHQPKAKDNGRCCSEPHLASTAILQKDCRNNPYTIYRWVRKPDSQVCSRERAWRKYISIRDGHNYCVRG